MGDQPIEAFPQPTPLPPKPLRLSQYYRIKGDPQLGPGALCRVTPVSRTNFIFADVKFAKVDSFAEAGNWNFQEMEIF